MSLKARLNGSKILVAPGVYDGLTATLAEAAGFEALYLSGAAVAYTRLGRPDIGLSTSSEMADTMTLIADRTDLPVIIDADTGFGNALNAQRTMRLYERAGAAALQIEDQTFPKRCGHLRRHVVAVLLQTHPGRSTFLRELANRLSQTNLKSPRLTLTHLLAYLSVLLALLHKKLSNIFDIVCVRRGVSTASFSSRQRLQLGV